MIELNYLTTATSTVANSICQLIYKAYNDDAEGDPATLDPEVWRLCYNTMTQLRRGCGRVVVATPHGHASSPVGVAAMDAMGDIVAWYVLPAYRGQGIGAALLAKACEHGAHGAWVHEHARTAVRAVGALRSAGFARERSGADGVSYYTVAPATYTA